MNLRWHHSKDANGRTFSLAFVLFSKPMRVSVRRRGDLGRAFARAVYRVAARIHDEGRAAELELERLIDAHVDDVGSSEVAS